MGAASKMK